MLSLRLGGLCDATHQGSDSHDVVTDRVQTESKAVPQAIEFRDPDAAARNLARVRTRLGSEAYQSLLYILAESPDPDSAVVMLARLLDVARKELGSASGSQFGLLHYACEVFAHSNWLGETLVRNPELLQRIAVGTELGRSWSCEEFREEFARFRARSGGADLSQTMSRFRKREYVRILLRDVLRIARIGEVTEEISALSDALLQEAVTAVNSQLAHRHGAPRWVDGHGRYGESRFAVVSLGKLGGNELNYSSDVDLMFLYDGGEAPPSARFSNREYFIELAQETTDLLSRPTLEGQVFRIDLRLRPQGHEGELAVALPRAIQYYSEMAQDWELQAMIKARHSAGDVSLTREFVHAIAPLVYRPNVNFAAIKTALQTRERIDRRGRNRPYSETPGQGINVKLDRGGIRDIEFLVQCLQRVYGGEEHWLRLRGTLFALQKLHDLRGARDALDASLKLLPGQYQARLLLGQVYLALKNPQPAEDQFEAALLLQSNSVEAEVGVAKAQIAEGNFAAAVQQLAPLSKSQLATSEIFDLLSQAYTGLGKVAEAQKAKARADALHKAQ